MIIKIINGVEVETRQMDQWNGIQVSPGVKANRAKTVFSRTTGHPHTQNTNVNTDLIPFTKIKQDHRPNYKMQND